MFENKGANHTKSSLGEKQVRATKILGGPYSKDIPLPRIPHNRELERDSLLPRTAVTAIEISDVAFAKVLANRLSSVQVAMSVRCTQ